jgi:hypothetical protein
MGVAPPLPPLQPSGSSEPAPTRTAPPLAAVAALAPSPAPITSAVPQGRGPTESFLAPVVSPEPAFHRLVALLRDVRVEAQNLQASLQEIKRKAALTDRQVRAQEVAAALQDAQSIFAYSRGQIDARLAAVRALLDQSPDLYDLSGDEVAQIEDLWQRITLAWPDPARPVDQVIAAVAAIESLLESILYHVGIVAIPPRVNQHLAQLRVGQTLDFHEAFRDELPDQKQRMEILRYLSAHPRSVDGLVDVERGVIYRVSPSAWRRRASLLMIALALAGGVLVVYLYANLGDWLGLSGWPATPGALGKLLAGYLFIVIGAAVHLGVDALKESRARPAGGITALDEGLLWLHVKELPITMGVLSLWVGIIGLALWQPDVPWQTAFFVGYSLDSFVDLFLQRFTRTVTARTGALQSQLGGTPASP